MRRQLITLFALFTGLAAIGTPVNAAMGELLGQPVQAGSQERIGAHQAGYVSAKPGPTPARIQAQPRIIAATTLPLVYSASVHIGIDRAHE